MKSHKLLLLIPITAFACGEADPLAGNDPFQRHEDEKVTVIGGDTTVPVATGDLNGEGCLQVTEDKCISVNREGTYCKTDSGPVDAVLVNGQVAQVVCYSDEAQKGPVTVIDTDGDGDVDVPQNENGAVIVFDPSTDGTAFTGNITLDANNVTLYGNGPDKSIIDGNLIITGNNARVRGVRVTGNVEIRLNTAALLLSVVEGNLIVESNNSLIAETKVFGNFTVGSNNCLLVGDGAGADWAIGGSGTICERNYRMMADGTHGEALSCAAQ